MAHSAVQSWLEKEPFRSLCNLLTGLLCPLLQQYKRICETSRFCSKETKDIYTNLPHEGQSNATSAEYSDVDNKEEDELYTVQGIVPTLELGPSVALNLISELLEPPEQFSDGDRANQNVIQYHIQRKNWQGSGSVAHHRVRTAHKSDPFQAYDCEITLLMPHKTGIRDSSCEALSSPTFEAKDFDRYHIL
ncbi:hypothetical protein PoB_001756400 [Plakobranchus ocellatus]|uniref:Uncharacterized protein n=1 Tax=Plakobranchus ocellatus TaxID=259542 RepID=A0AAV3ZAT8_9GAST|nr:hypothetical protein PoB_001756400 [Plakobranchus ocellatus]